MFVRLAVMFALVESFVSPAFSQVAAPAELAKQPADSLDGPPLVSAKGWIIGDGRTGCRLWGFEDAAARPIASTTKMMTAWLIVQLIERDPAVLHQQVTFSERADKTNGSTAAIAAGERVSTRDLLYGLLLPSGNDAATALAEHFGGAFAATDDSNDLSPQQCADGFIAEMNRTAQRLGMADTKYLDPHGLGGNQSSPRDLLRLACTAMQSETFRRYVGTPRYEGTLTAANGSQRKAVWNNTNRLLEMEGFDGVKTGTTTAAGNCLVSSCHRGDKHLIVVVLGSTSTDGRYLDTRNLVRWAWQQEQP